MVKTLNEGISDSRLKGFLQKYIRDYSPLHKLNLSSIYFCGRSPLSLPGLPKGVYLLSNGTESVTLGTTHCNSSWACPVCTPKVMARYGDKIACAIDALATKGDQSAMMITMTIPHMPFMDCEDCLQLIMKAWRHFTKSSKSKTKDTFTKKDGTTSHYKKNSGAFCKMCTELGIKHSVRVYEATHGENSWHIHIHGLLWCPNYKWEEIAQYEEPVFEYWWKCIELEARKYWRAKLKDRPDGQQKADELVNDMCADWRKYPKTGHRSFYISKTKDGKIRKATSSRYICGWSTNHELTGLSQKTARNGHRSPTQILEDAYKNYYEKRDMDAVKKDMDLYLEYAKQTRGHNRINFSIGLNKIIEEWKTTEEYWLRCKKKAMDKEQKAPFKIVAYFTLQQWLNLLFVFYIDKDEDWLSEILELARLPNGRELIETYCLNYEVDIRDNIIPKADFVEKVINDMYRKVS